MIADNSGDGSCEWYETRDGKKRIETPKTSYEQGGGKTITE